MAKKSDGMKITSRNTKAEILKAYEELKSSMEEKKAENAAGGKAKEAKMAEEQKLVSRASSNTMESIINNISDLRLVIGKSLNELSDKLIDETERLHEIREAIDIEKKNLEEIHNIQVAADALSLLIQEYEEKKAAFENQALEREQEHKRKMQEMVEAWNIEKEKHDRFIKERDEQVKIERQREEEEYNYNLKLFRKKDKDEYERKEKALELELKEKRDEFEREFARREELLAEREQELKDLRQKVESFDSVLEKSVKETAKSATNAAEQKAHTEMTLYKKEKEGEVKLLELKIESLKEEIVKQATQIDVMSKQLSDANSKVLSIATKAIEGASGAKTLKTVHEIALEQAKRTKEFSS